MMYIISLAYLHNSQAGLRNVHLIGYMGCPRGVIIKVLDF